MNVTVIIPCFNCAEFISRAISSSLNQTYAVEEIILVDNNSTDNTPNVLGKWKSEYPDKIIVLSELEKGATNARNKGLAHAKGTWIQFLDADDELLPDKIKKQIEICRSEDKPDIIVGGCIIIYNKNKYERPLEKKDLWKGLINSQLGITSANLYRKEPVIQAGGWNSENTSSQEYDLMFRLLKNNSIIKISEEPLTNIYVQKNSLHKSKSAERFIEILNNNVNLRLKLREYFYENNIYTKERKLLIDKYVFSYLINTTGVFPFFHYNGKVGKYVKYKILQANIKLPFSFVLGIYSKLFKKKVKNKLLMRST